MGSRRARSQKIVFPSGLVLVHESARASPAVAYHLWVKVGSAHESRAEGGVSHFLEHMLFKGTENRDAIQLNDEIENLGGNINAFTSFEQTAYHLQLSNRFWREGLNVLLDMVFHARLDEEEMEIERQVILEELREGNDALDNVLGEKFYEVLYPDHGYGRPVIGTMESVRGLRHADLCSYFHRWYRPDNMILAVAGDVDWHSLVEAVRELSSDNDPTDPLVPTQVGNPANLDSLRYVAVTRGEQERILDLAFSIPGVDHPDVPALDVLSYVLGEGEVSRLYREIRVKQQLARSVGSSMFSPFKTGKFVIQGLPYEERDLDLLKSFLEQIRLLHEEEVSATELNRAKLNLDKEIVFNDETVEGRAKSLAYYETVFGSVEYEAKYRDQIFSVTERQVQEITRRYLDPRQMGIALLRPKSEQAPSLEQLQDLVDQAMRPKTQRRAMVGVPSLDADVERWKLPGGVRVVFRHFPGVRISSLYASAVGGLWAESADVNGISQLIASTVDRGTASRSDEQIAEEKIFLQAEMAAVAGKSSQGQRMDVVSGNLLSALDLFADVLIDPLFEESVVEQERTAMLRELETQKDYFETRTNNLFLESMFPGHPYGFNLLGTPDSLRRLTSEKLQKHYQAVVRPERLVIGIVAD
ncbi:MAG TPA: insulinase family protein, partial [Bdellovibrionota bacterium]|nr:insulinase family protein [Bdellovibrionota bacterium]